MSASRQNFPVPDQPCWFHTLIALHQHSPLSRRYYPTENWLSSRCLTLVIICTITGIFILISVGDLFTWVMPGFRDLDGIIFYSRLLTFSSFKNARVNILNGHTFSHGNILSYKKPTGQYHVFQKLSKSQLLLLRIFITGLGCNAKQHKIIIMIS